MIKKILNKFTKASGQKVNWNKSALMRVGMPPRVHMREVKMIMPGEADPYLGVPVGVNIFPAIQLKWENTIEKMRLRKASWVKGQSKATPKHPPSYPKVATLCLAAIHVSVKLQPASQVTSQKLLDTKTSSYFTNARSWA